MKYIKYYRSKDVKSQAKVIDTGAGFFLEDEVEDKAHQAKVVHPEGMYLLELCNTTTLYTCCSIKNYCLWS